MQLEGCETHESNARQETERVRGPTLHLVPSEEQVRANSNDLMRPCILCKKNERCSELTRYEKLLSLKRPYRLTVDLRLDARGER